MVECPGCGTANSPGARFCNSCGATLESTAAGVRKVVTVLFCDLVGSTTLGDGADPEVLREHMARYHATLRRILEHHGGRVEKFIGDAAMAVFGLPASHEDDALRAVRAAGEIRHRVGELGFSVRIGINTGEVVAGAGETLVTGDAVNLAARLEQSAAPGEILIGELTHRLVKDAARSEPLDAITVKGKAAPVVAHRLLNVEDEVGTPGRRHAAPFVGRTAELDRVQRAFTVAIEQRQPQLATIVGPPGIGKSRLVRELITRSSGRVLMGRCLSYGQGITYWPLQEIAQQISDIPAILARRDDGALAATRLQAALGEGAATPEEIAWAFRILFEALAEDEPLIVVVDDIHWAEPTLLDLIEYLADFSRDAKLLLLCTARPDLLEARPDWSAPRPNAQLLTLEPLATGHVETLVDQLGALPQGDRARIIDAAEGNPLFVEQLVAMRGEAAVGDDRLDIPPTIQALLAARIDRLEAGERAVIERAAVEGRLFHRGSVHHLVPDAVRPEVGRRLLTLVRRQFIRPDRAELPGDDGFRFDHVLIRDAAYESLPKKLRAELHERFADFLEGRLGANAPAEILGYHLEQAHRYGVELGAPDEALGERAAEKLIAAARTASSRQDVGAETNLLKRAVTLLPTGSRKRPRALANLGTALFKAQDHNGAIDVLREAEAAAETQADHTAYWLARLRRRHVESGQDPEGAVEALLREGEAALAARPDDDEVAALAWWVIGGAHGWRGHLAQQHEASQVAWAHARRSGNALLEMDIVYSSGGPIAYGPISVQDGLQWVARVVEVAQNRVAAELWARHMLAHLHARLGDFVTARAEMDSWRMQMRELGDVWRYVGTAACAWDVCDLAGDPAGAERALREAYEEAQRTGDRGVGPSVAALLADALVAQGKLDEAEQYVRLSEEQAPSEDVENQASWRRVKAQLLAQRGKLEEAVPLAREAARIISTTDLLDDRARTWRSLASVLIAAGRADEATAALNEAIELYKTKGNLVGRAQAEALLPGDGAQAGT